MIPCAIKSEIEFTANISQSLDLLLQCRVNFCFKNSFVMICLVSDYDYFSVSGDQDVEQTEFDKSSTIPRNSDISQSYRRMFQAKRPASTAGLPTNCAPAMMTPGVATIRRTPSTKPSVRRGTIGAGPIPIKTPVIPVLTPTVPEAGGYSGLQLGPEECSEQGLETSENNLSSAACTQALATSPVLSQSTNSTEEERQSVMSQQMSAVPPATKMVTAAVDNPGAASSLQEPVAAGESSSAPLPPQGEDMLSAIRRGVKLRKTTTNDRSAPRFS